MMKLFELDLDLGPTCRIHLARAKLAPPPCAYLSPAAVATPLPLPSTNEGSGSGVATAAGSDRTRILA